ncbi:hypothetical protein [Liquorilactobacillus ghanensis]|uniref:Rgg/GadR/MutR family transcriptional regulator n=1 Tax=Liquorilactobacillus ghanensis TaxID=399370 RepID=UPI0039E82D9B
MMSSGEIVKQIRLSKGLKAKYVYKDLMTQSTSSRYERGKEEIKIAKLLVIIARLNLEFSEFIYLFKAENEEFKLFEKYHQRLLKAFKKGEIMELELINQYAINLYQFNHLSCFNHLAQLASCMTKKISKKQKDFTVEKKIIIDYLLKTPRWSKYEYQLFDEALFMFTEDDIKRLLNSDRWENFYNKENDFILARTKVQLLAHVIVLLIKDDHFSTADTCLMLLNQVEIAATDIWSKCYKSFIVGVNMVKDGDLKQGAKIISETLTSCEEFKLFQLNKELMYNLKICLDEGLVGANSN